MAPSLPRPVQLKLDQTLAQWRRWRCEPPLHDVPHAVQVLGTGHSNYSILVAGATRFVVRIDGVNPAAHGLNRQGEWRILHAAHAAGLAPRPCYFNPDLGSLVCEYLEPRQEAPQSPADVARLLRCIHRLPASHSRLELRERIGRYERQLAHRQQPLPEALERLREGVATCLARTQARGCDSVLCHNDLLRANRIASRGPLQAIDWEYSAMGDPLYELAVVICGDELCPAVAAELVSHYLERRPRREERQALHDYAAIYRYLALLWYLVQDHPAMDAEHRAREIASLEAALAQAMAADR